MRRIVLCGLVCVVCAFCVGAEVQDVSKSTPTKDYVEIWRVRETRRWTYDDGDRWNERLEYDLYVFVNSSGDAYEFQAWPDFGPALWQAWPELGRPWNDWNERRPYVCFSGPYYAATSGTVVAQLKINRKWEKANGKITGSINLYGWNAYLDARIRAEYETWF